MGQQLQKLQEAARLLLPHSVDEWKQLTVPIKDSLKKKLVSTEARSARSALLKSCKDLCSSDPDEQKLLENASRYRSDEALEQLCERVCERAGFDSAAYESFALINALKKAVGRVRAFEIAIARSYLEDSLQRLDDYFQQNPPETFGKFLFRLKDLSLRMKRGALPTHSGKGVTSDLNRALNLEFGACPPEPVTKEAALLQKALSYVADSLRVVTKNNGTK